MKYIVAQAGRSLSDLRISQQIANVRTIRRRDPGQQAVFDNPTRMSTRRHACGFDPFNQVRVRSLSRMHRRSVAAAIRAQVPANQRQRVARIMRLIPETESMLKFRQV